MVEKACNRAGPDAECRVSIQTQEKHTVGFGQTTTCIDFRPVALKKEHGYDYGVIGDVVDCNRGRY